VYLSTLLQLLKTSLLKKKGGRVKEENPVWAGGGKQVSFIENPIYLLEILIK
jgi:hypothetical protein